MSENVVRILDGEKRICKFKIVSTRTLFLPCWRKLGEDEGNVDEPVEVDDQNNESEGDETAPSKKVGM